MIYPRPTQDTGLGFHDSANAYSSPSDIAAHARAMRWAGISWYKLLCDGTNKLERARIYRAHGIMPIIRLWHNEPHPSFVPNSDTIRAYVQAGAPYFEFGNEPNLTGEWEHGRAPEFQIAAKQIAQQWIRGAAIVKGAGGIPLMFALSPGGNFEHRAFTLAFLDELRRLNALGSLEDSGIAIHPRPHNNPPDTPTTATNTVTFNEYIWIARAYESTLGWIPPLFATEHGYSPGSSENTEYPPIDNRLWVDHNRALFERMNPNHPTAPIKPYLYALCYWLECQGGTWERDAAFRDWMAESPRADDPAWGKAIYQIRPAWNRALQTPPILEPLPTPVPIPPPREDAGVKLAIPYLSQLLEYANLYRADCGPTVVAMILQALGNPLTPNDVSRAVGGVPDDGVDITTLSQVAGTLGATLHWRRPIGAGTLRSELSAGHPIITLVWYPLLPRRYDLNYRQGHYILITGYDASGFFYNDPYWRDTRGEGIYISESDLFRIWSTPRTTTGFHPQQGLILRGAVIPSKDSPAPTPGLTRDKLFAIAAPHQRIQLNINAALQKVILTDGFIPISGEFEFTEGVDYVGQLSERLSDGRQRVYYVVKGRWGDVGFMEK